MSAGDSLQQAWRWLVPPQVEDGLGGLIPRKRQRGGSSRFGEHQSQNMAGSDEKTALALVSSGDVAIEIGAKKPELLSHPNATHRAQLQKHEVAYCLRRSTRRSIGFSIGPKGLEVTAPQWATMGSIESALQTKSGWIVRKLQEAAQRQSIRQEARIHWQDGGVLDYLGQPMALRLTGDVLQPLRTRQVHREQRADGSQRLHLPLAEQASEAQVRASVQAWILREARTHFTARLLHFAPLVGVRWNALRLSSAATRWGSANSEGVIRLNWRLMQHSPRIIDYVVVHELAHLHHMDHSPQFWAVVAGVLPDWKQLRSTLKDKPLPAWSPERESSGELDEE